MGVLEQTLNELIAKELGVRPEDVTTELIRERRKLLYESDQVTFTGTAPGLQVLTFRELREMDTRAQKFLSQFA